MSMSFMFSTPSLNIMNRNMVGSETAVRFPAQFVRFMLIQLKNKKMSADERTKSHKQQYSLKCYMFAIRVLMTFVFFNLTTVYTFGTGNLIRKT